MPRKKVAFIGSGSFGFVRSIVKDIWLYPALSDCEIMLMDINPKNLENSRRLCEHIKADLQFNNAIVTATTDLKEALTGANGVLCTIECSDDRTTAADVNIPLKYGISLAVADTRGPSAIFRFLRTWPHMLKIVRTIEEVCPNAIFLNYTNPMAMLCRAMQEVSDICVTGLCHSVQGTIEQLAEWIGAPLNEITYLCAGINHQSHYLKIDWNGKDAYPLIRKALENPEIYQQELVRNDMFKHFGYYVTESSGHNSEYVWWYRKRPDLLEKYCTHSTSRHSAGKQRGVSTVAEREARRESRIEEFLLNPVPKKRSYEYASDILNAVFGDNTMFEFNGNVRNWGLIDNLPRGVCVEVPVVASLSGIKSTHVGSLPPQLALLNSVGAQHEELAVEGCLTGNKDLIYQACYFDPLTATMCSLEEIRMMVDEMFAEHEGWLPMFNI